MEKDTGVFLLRGPRFEMEPVYNGTIFNSTGSTLRFFLCLELSFVPAELMMIFSYNWRAGPLSYRVYNFS